MFVYSPTKQTNVKAGPAGRENIRAHNSALVLRLLWADSKGLSRSDIARESGLSKATVSAIIAELTEAGLVAEGRQQTSSGGRPGTTLRFRHDHYRIIGVELGASHVTVIRMNLAGEIQDSRSFRHDVRDDPSGAIRLTNRLIDETIDACDRPIIGMGIGVPAPLHAATPGRISARVHPKWADVDVHAEFGASRPFPVRLENDANLGALAEHWWGSGRNCTDFTYVKVSTGVGAGLIIDGDIYRGPGGIAGELGHMVIEGNARPSQINDLLGSDHLLHWAYTEAEASPDPADTYPYGFDMNFLTTAAKNGQPSAVKVVQQAGHWLGIALSNLCNITNPSQVVIGGPLTAAGAVLMEPVTAAMQRHVLHLADTPPMVLVTSLKDEAVALGGATAILQSILSDPRLLSARDVSEAESATAPPVFLGTRNDLLLWEKS